MDKLMRFYKISSAEILMLKTKAQEKLKEQSGQLLVDHAGWVAVIVLIIGVVIVFTLPTLKNDVLPAIKQKVMNLFTYNG